VVPLHGDVLVPVHFSIAHRRLEVRIVGHSGTPMVTLENLPEGSNMFTGAVEGQRVETQAKAPVADGNDKVVSFTTFMFDWDDPDVMVRIDGYEINLAEEIEKKYPGGVDDSVVLVVSISVSFQGVGVKVTVKEWGRTGTVPSL
jgi:hypothetical protein